MRSVRMGIVALSAVLAIAAFGCGDDDDGPTNPGTTVDVTITIPSGAMDDGPNAYNPDTANVAVGQKVRWINNDAMAHTATADLGSFNTGLIPPNGGASAIITIAGSPGLRNYHCEVSGHNMQGVLNVTP